MSEHPLRPASPPPMTESAPLSTPECSPSAGTQRRDFLSATLAAWSSLSLADCGGGSADAAIESTSGTTPLGEVANRAKIQAATTTPAPVPPVRGGTPTSPPPPSPPPPPPAAPVPAPPPASTGAALAPPPIGAVQTQPLNLANLVQLDVSLQSGPYERYRRLLVLSGSRATVKFNGFNFAAGGLFTSLKGKRYTLLVDGQPAAAVDVVPLTTRASFDLDVSKLQPGWRRLDIGGLTDGETAPTYWAFVKRGSVGEQPFTPVVRGSNEMAMAADGKAMWVLAPGKYNPQPKPLPGGRTYLSPSPKLPRSELHCEQLIPIRWGDIYRPNVNTDGLLSAFDAQAYFWSTLHAKLPILALLDGPRGVGTASMITHITLGVAAPDGRPRNTTYFCDPWRVGKISETGTITTLVGYRHKGVLGHWEDADLSKGLELIGDWSSIPNGRRGFHELWSMVWDDRTLGINEAAPRIPSEENEKPHLTGPVMFVADTQNNRICRIEFSATAHGVPPKVTEFITGILDPWELVYDKGVLYITERLSHRIASYDATTGALLRVIVQGKPLAYVDQNREVKLLGTLAQVQAADCVAPEGLALQDGWLYFASKAQAQVKRVKLDTGEIQVVRPVLIDGNSKFAKLALSDGTFGPRGSTFTWTWSVQHFGYPAMHLPDGTQLPIWWTGKGGTGHWKDHCGYAISGAIGQGRMITAGMVEGLIRVTKSQAGDTTPNAAADRGRQEWMAKGLHMLHGHNGFGLYGLPLPWGESADIDAYLESFGHTKA